MPIRVYDFNPRKLLDEVAFDCTTAQDRVDATRFIAEVSVDSDPLVSMAAMVRCAVNDLHRDDTGARAGVGLCLLLVVGHLSREILKAADA